MEYVNIVVHNGSCVLDNVDVANYIEALKKNLVKYNPSISIINSPIDGYHIEGYSSINFVNSTKEEENEIYLIIENTYNYSKQNN